MTSERTGWVSVRGAKLTKGGNSEAECEDHFSIQPSSEFWAAHYRGSVAIAVSDGASESFLAGRWAQLVASRAANTVLEEPQLLSSEDSFEGLLLTLQEEWRSWKSEYLHWRQRDGRPIQWYEEHKLAEGAYATLLAMRLEELDEDGVRSGAQNPSAYVGRWQAVAIGDSCLFQVRDSSIVTLFPLTSSSEFHSHPVLMGSWKHSLRTGRNGAVFISSGYKYCDDFFLMTDAMAAWLMDRSERTTSREFAAAVEELKSVIGSGDRNKFEAWVTHQRLVGGLRNDDVAVVHIHIRG